MLLYIGHVPVCHLLYSSLPWVRQCLLPGPVQRITCFAFAKADGFWDMETALSVLEQGMAKRHQMATVYSNDCHL